eukprot:scaffold60183_cov51-Attheya_sp.AAC.3
MGVLMECETATVRHGIVRMGVLLSIRRTTDAATGMTTPLFSRHIKWLFLGGWIINIIWWHVFTRFRPLASHGGHQNGRRPE